MQTTPSTELEAINEMLGVIGESPVSTVEDNGLVDAAIARQILTSTSRVVQSKRWHFNTDVGVKITPEFISKNLTLPNNLLVVDTSGCDASLDLVQRGSRLYNRRTQSYKFDNPVTVNMCVMLDFEELPESARYYITIRAARIFQGRVVGSTELAGFTEYDETMALVTLETHDGINSDNNIFTDNSTSINMLG